MQVQHDDLLSSNWPTPTVVVLAAVALTVWCAAHWVSRRLSFRALGLPLFLLRCGVGTAAMWLACNALSRSIALATSWSIVAICAMSAIAIELILSLYVFERRFVSARLGSTLAVLRTALVLTLSLMLLQPVLTWSLRRSNDRYIAVLIDDSQSMQISDQQLTDSEKLRLIRVFDPTIAKPPYDLGSAVAELSPLADKLGAAAAAVAALAGSEDAQNEFILRRRSVEDVLRRAQKVASRQSQRIGDLTETEVQLKAETRQAAQAQQRRLDSDVVARLVEAEQLIQQHASDIEPHLPTLSQHMRGAAVAIRDVLLSLPELIDDADRSYFASLPPEKVRQAKEILSQTRADLARALLLDGSSQADGLIRKIQQGYKVRVFRFDEQCNELDIERWSGDQPPLTEVVNRQPAKAAPTVGDGDVPPASGQPDGQPDGLPDGQTPVGEGPLTEEAANRTVTDVAAALETVQREIPVENLAGILLVTDGRHNGPGDLESVVRQLASQEVSVSALVVGSSRPPVNAAIVDVEYPSTVLVDDLLTVNARVKLTGMRGRSVRVKLREGDDLLQEKSVIVTNDDFTTTVELGHTPKQEGFRNYLVEVEPLQADQVESQAFQQNSRRALSVAVSDNRTEILLIERRPRWEYGYLRNLFAGRDVTVQLQTLLMEPDRLAGDGQLPPVHASASRSADEIEATLLPTDEAEWLKFDVIILGDISPQQLPAEQQQVLNKFVSQRGGALIVIAGQHNMPHRFGGTALAELLPVEFAAANEIQFAPPEPSFEFQLTNVGLRQAIMQQADSVEASAKIWKSMPPMHWRHAVTGVKPGAVVLAYASNEAAEQQLLPQENETPEQAESRRRRRDELQKQHALLVIQKFGLGRVLMLNTDRTWRFRYRIGDTYHHRFWGQVVRWATSQRLQAGSQFVQLGTDRVTYEAGDSVLVTAKITDSYFAPVEDQDAVIKVFRGDELLISKTLEPEDASPGSYRVNLGKLPGHGAFRIELDSPRAKQIFAGSEDGQAEAQVTVESPQIRSLELIEPTADRDELVRLTSLAGGGVVEADTRDDVFDYFSSGSQSYTDVRSITLWDTWPLLCFMVVLVTAEWIFRKAGGLI